jgi:hypothetical protein
MLLHQLFALGVLVAVGAIEAWRGRHAATGALAIGWFALFAAITFASDNPGKSQVTLSRQSYYDPAYAWWACIVAGGLSDGWKPRYVWWSLLLWVGLGVFTVLGRRKYCAGEALVWQIHILIATVAWAVSGVLLALKKAQGRPARTDRKDRQRES